MALVPFPGKAPAAQADEDLDRDPLDDDLEGDDDVDARGREDGEKERGEKGRDRDDRQPDAKIEELLKEGQDVVVQVAKEPLGTKGARLTCHVTLPGRFLVFGDCWRFADGDQLMFRLDTPDCPVVLYLHEDRPPTVEPFAPSFSLALWRMVHEVP